MDLQGYQVRCGLRYGQMLYLFVMQVSNQCMALVRDNCLVPTLDAPELGYVRESTPEQLVPDVFYKVASQ